MTQEPKASVEPDMVNGISLDHWERVFAPHVIEFCATRWAYTNEDGEQIRIAFGNRGPFTSANGERDKPNYTHAVTLPLNAAIELAQMLLQHIAQVKPKTAV